MRAVPRPLALRRWALTLVAIVTASLFVSVAPSALAASGSATAVDRSGWTLSASGAWYPVENAVDGDDSTSWLADGDQREGMWFQIDAGAETTFDAIELRQSGEWNNTSPRAYVVETSSDAVTWTVAATGLGSSEHPVIGFDSTVTARHVRVTLTQTVGSGEGGWSISEVNLIRSLAHDRDGWVATASGAWIEPSNALDGDGSTSWLSNGDQQAGMWFQVDAGRSVTFDAVETARSEWDNAYPRAYRIEVSDDASAWSVVAEVAGSNAQPRVHLAEPATARYVRITLTSSVGAGEGGWAISEFTLLSTEVTPAPRAISSASEVRPGQGVQLMGSHFLAGAYRVELRTGAGAEIGTAVTASVAADGALSATVTVPESASTGSYTIVVVRTGDDIDVLSIDLAVTNAYTHDRSRWTPTASGEWISAGNAIDGNRATSWLGDGDQRDGMWFQIDAHEPVTFDVVGLAQSGEWSNSYPRAFVVEVSDDADVWRVVAETRGTFEDQRVVLDEPATSRYVRLRLTEGLPAGGGGWSIGEVDLVYSHPVARLTAEPDVNAGRTVTVSGRYFAAGDVVVELRAAGSAAGVVLGQPIQVAGGSFDAELTVPADVTPGAYELVALAAGDALARRSIDVLPVAPDAARDVEIRYEDGQVRVTWPAVPDAVEYTVERATGRYSDFSVVDTTRSTAFSQHMAEADRYDYYYRVIAISEPGGLADPSTPVALETELFGDAMNFFSPTDDPKLIDELTVSTGVRMKPMTQEFSDERIVFAFKPGQYDTSTFEVSYYTSVYGLGETPLDTVIPNVQVLASGTAGQDGNALTNFWRSIENIGIDPDGAPAPCATNGSVIWAASQAAPARRLWVDGDLQLDHCSKASSGGFLADSVVTGQTATWAQQQYFLRNNALGAGWQGGNWNIVFVGSEGAPAAPADWSTVDRAWTIVDETPVVREKPFPYFDQDAGDYAVFVPETRRDSSGVSWAEGDPGAGTSIPVDEFHVARPEVDDADSINAALDAGKHLLLTPGIYEVDEAIRVTDENTVVLGLGMATIRPTGGTDGMQVADVGGVTVAGVLFDATDAGSDHLLQVGPDASTQDHSENPTLISDVFTRVGGAVFGRAETTVEVNSSNVITDHLWLWRADHGTEITQGGEKLTGWDKNTSAHGIIVNGDAVTAYALFVEHFQDYQTVWNGDDGATYFYQSELPYDPTAQDLWMSRDGVNGYASYKVTPEAQGHVATGLGVYNVFLQTEGAWIESLNAIEVSPGTIVRNAATVSLTHPDYGGVGGIQHVVNGVGESTVGTTIVRRGVNEYIAPVPEVTSTIVGELPVGGWYANGAAVELALDDALSSLEYRVDEAEWQPYVAAVTVDQSGVHTLEYRVRHLGAVYAPAAGSVEVKVGTEPVPAPSAYNPRAVYTGGERVSYQGKVYLAQWWTSGLTPSATQWGAWAEVGKQVLTPQGSFLTWTASWTYTGGETVVHNGEVFRAKWWTRNQVPGDPWGPWQSLGSATS